MNKNDVNAMIAEWEASADKEIEAALKSDLEGEELRREIAKEHPHLSEEDVDEMARQMGADLAKVRGNC